MHKCDIIIPVWNQLEITRECLNSIFQNTDYPYRLIIIDNGSERKTGEYLNNLSTDKSMDILLVKNNKNIGFVKAAN